MRILQISPAIAVILAIMLAAPPTNALETTPIWGFFCVAHTFQPYQRVAVTATTLPPVASCGPEPSVFHEIPEVGGGGDVVVPLLLGYDAANKRLCLVNKVLNEAPVIRVGVGHRLTINLTNTLRDTGNPATVNCAVQTYGGEGLCVTYPIFLEQPGADGSFYPLAANQQHTADGTTNLHVHGLFVSPQPCSDEVLASTIYPTNWGSAVGLTSGCQTSPNNLVYTYDLPANHPAGLYWYHSHRHGQSEQQTQMGAIGAIIVEDSGDTYRRSIGVSDEVLILGDKPIGGCLVGVSCDGTNQSATVPEPGVNDPPPAPVSTVATPVAGAPTLDPRVDQVNQAGECASGAADAQGGTQLWTLTLNGADVPEAGSQFPADYNLLRHTMHPGQRQIFRLVNASADSFVAPQLWLKQDGKLSRLPLEVWARDGVGLTDAAGNRHIGVFDVGQNPIVVPPAGRIEFVVHAPPVGAKQYLETPQILPGCGGNLYPARRLLLMTSAGTAVDPGAADDSDLLQNTPSLANYIPTIAAAPTVHRTFVFAEYGRNFTYGVADWLSGPPTISDYNPSQTDFYITEVASDDGEVVPSQTAMVPFQMGSVAPNVVVHLHGQDSVTEEWLVENSTLEAHDFHIHQIHFRDISRTTTNLDLQPVLDSVTVPAAPLVGNVVTGGPGAPGWVRLRMTFTKNDIGTFVYHCHILEHEDNGMMGRVQVVAD